MAARTASAKESQAHTPDRKDGVSRRLSWVLLVGVIPVIVGIVIIGGALQFVGVPVWQTTLHVAGLNKPVQQNSAQTQTEKQLKSLEAQVKTLTAEKAKLSQANQTLTHQGQQLETQVSTLQKQVQVQTTHIAAGEQEARVLSQMDAQSAASVLQKMGTDKAAWVVASMSPDASGPILQAAPTSFASSVIQQAAVDKQSAAEAANTSGQSANGAVGVGTTH